MTAPSYEQLAALVAAQERTIAQLQARIAEQDARIVELERQLAASSRNSSRPPSSDGLDKLAPKSLRGRSGRRPGGQPGREGRTLRQVAVPDAVVVHEPGACAGCGSTLPADGPPTRMIRVGGPSGTSVLPQSAQAPGSCTTTSSETVTCRSVRP